MCDRPRARAPCSRLPFPCRQQGDESLAIAVHGSLRLGELDLVLQAALDGAGFAGVAEDRVTEHLASGALLRVLEDWGRPFPAFFLYYPSSRAQAQHTAKIRRDRAIS